MNFNHEGNKMNKAILKYRQGDVGLVAIAALPAGAIEEKKANKVILAYGEVTGHHHRFEDVLERPKAPKVRVFSAGAERFIQVMEKSMLLHEEHGSIPVEPGIYRVGFDIDGKATNGVQRTYSPAEIQRVVD
jgi:hypothetical protein